MKKYTWYVFTVKDDEGKLYSWAERIPHCYDLLHYATREGIYTMNACDSKRQAEEIAKDWNETYIKNGTANKWLAA